MDRNELDAKNIPWQEAWRSSRRLHATVLVVTFAQLIICWALTQLFWLEVMSVVIFAGVWVLLSNKPTWLNPHWAVWHYKTGLFGSIDYDLEADDHEDESEEELQADGSLKVTESATRLIHPGEEVKIILCHGQPIPASYSEALRQRFCEPGGQVVYRQRFDRTFGNWEYELVDDPTLD